MNVGISGRLYQARRKSFFLAALVAIGCPTVTLEKIYLRL